MKNMNFTISQKSNVVFGEGVVGQTGAKLRSMGIATALCIYDRGVKVAGIVDLVLNSMENAGIKIFIFDGVESDAPVGTVEAAAAMARSNEVDAIVAIGGGSTLDTAKATNILISNPSPITKYFDFTVPQKDGVMLITIPTTAGTGSEITSGAVLYDTANNQKKSVLGRNCTATLAIVDPTLTVGVPPHLTAATGMDTMSHMIGSYTNIMPNAWCDILNEAGIKMVKEYLPRAIKNPSDMEARNQMSFACLIAGTQMCDGYPHIDHSLAHAIAAKYHIHHGVLCALSLPYALKQVAKVNPDRAKRAGELLGIKFSGNETKEEISEKVAKGFISFNKELGLGKLRDYATITDDELNNIADTVLTDVCFGLTPGAPSKEEVYQLLKEMYEQE